MLMQEDRNSMKNSFRTNVRFSEAEYNKICEDSANLGETVPNLLKQRYFSNRITRPMFDKEDTRKLQVELNRIGNNINQIAREVNDTGNKEGLTDPIIDLTEQLRALKDYLRLKDGGC